MSDEDIRSVESIEDVEEYLTPCINVVYGRSYRVVLRKIVEVFKSSGCGASFYYLSKKEKVLNSYDMLKRALNTLMECGYIMCKEGRSKTNRQKIDYYPTPLGVVMNLILTLLHPEESDIYKYLTTHIVSNYIAEETFFELIPYMFHITILKISPPPDRTPSLAKGWLTTEYAADLVAIKVATKVNWRIFPGVFLNIPIFRENLWERVEKIMYEQLNYLKDIKEHRVKELIEDLEKTYESISLKLPEEVKDSLHKSVTHLYDTFKLLCKSIETHGDIRLETYGRLRIPKIESY
jgi:hypothetical protein